MRLTREQIVERSEELADYAESFDPDKAEQVPIAEYRLWRVVRNRSADEALMLDAIAEARDDGVSIDRIAEIVGVSADAARELCGKSVDQRRSRESKPRSRGLGI
ncbi:hypothetical protein [Candidatus Poriferisodalis sp.]|uniref:hypothetical protein n=1 Tax=Candidatus Poriferisodalis sp. TaxID=3101277 RepID=UPI003B01BC6D